MTITIRVEGLKQLERNISTYSQKQKDELSDAIQTGALNIAGDAKRLAPVDTGALRNSIQYTRVNDLNAEVGTNIEYAAHQEFGTERMRAQPYMRPAVEINAPFIISNIKRAVIDSKP